MKTKILFILIITINFSFSQEIFTSKRGKIYENGQRINAQYIETAFGNNKEIVDLYSSGKTKQTLGNILLYGGISTLIIKDISDRIKISERTGIIFNGPYSYTTYTFVPNKLMYVIGGAMVVSAIPIKIGYSRKIKAAAKLMNDEIKNQKQTSSESLNLVYDQNGFGVSFHF
jgi:hypothetical protein